jgi:capsular polysaccharide transport system permease protein
VNSARSNLEKADAALILFRNQANGEKASFIVQFQKLQLERDTAEQQLGSAIAALEQARIDAQRKRLFIERISNPNLPDYPLEPKRVYGILATLLLMLIIYSIIRMVVAGVREHHD